MTKDEKEHSVPVLSAGGIFQVIRRFDDERFI